MTKAAGKIDEFNREYCDRIRDVVWEAIVRGSRDSTTDLAPLRNYEIYDALLQIQAMILASSKDSSSPTKMRMIGIDFAKRLRRLVSEFKEAYGRDGIPFDVIHTDDMH